MCKCNCKIQLSTRVDLFVFRLSKVHVHLEGGNLCDSDEACVDRCDQDHDGQVDNGLCTGPVIQARGFGVILHGNATDFVQALSDNMFLSP